MLQEMGVTVWAPAQAAATATATSIATPHATESDASPQARPTQARAAPIPAGPSAASATPAAPAVTHPTIAARTTPAAGTGTSPANTHTNPPGAASGQILPALRLHAPQALYPAADPAATPAELGGGWLIVTESLSAAEPLKGDAGRLLDNMLRAMRLHLHPRVFVAALERTLPGTEAADDIAATLAHTVQSLQPAMVLVLGHVAARVALGRTEPLGRLRAGPHQLAGCPAVVTYDPAFLLRSQDNKAAAWADLCHALAMVRGAHNAA